MTDQQATQQVFFAVEDAIVEAVEARHHVVTSIGEWEDYHPHGGYHMELWIEPEVVPPKPELYWYGRPENNTMYGVLRTGPGGFERHEFECSPEFRRADYHTINARMAELNRALDAAENNSRRIDMMMEEGLI